MAPTTVAEFASALSRSIPIGHVFKNPGPRGTTTILEIDSEGIRYQRGDWRHKRPMKAFYESYSAFRGQRVTTKDLKAFAPDIFDSAAGLGGHNCNCTVLFMLLHAAGLSGPIEGKGTRSSLFSVSVK